MSQVGVYWSQERWAMLSQALSYRNFSETVDGSEILHQIWLNIQLFTTGFMHPRWFSRRISEPSTV